MRRMYLVHVFQYFFKNSRDGEFFKCVDHGEFVMVTPETLSYDTCSAWGRGEGGALFFHPCHDVAALPALVVRTTCIGQ